MPGSSKLLVVIAVVLAVLGVVLATRWGRRVCASTCCGSSSSRWPASVRWPAPRAGSLALFGGSIGVTLAYVAALACAAAAFDAGVSFAQVGAVYLGSSLIAAAAPTPGGLGAMEAALVAGFTGDRHGRRRSPWPRCSATGWRPTGCRSCRAGSASESLERRNYI